MQSQDQVVGFKETLTGVGQQTLRKVPPTSNTDPMQKREHPTGSIFSRENVFCASYYGLTYRLRFVENKEK